MNKKFLSAILFGALMFGSVGTFTSCKDYDDDISNLQKQIDENAKAIDQINTLISNGSVITNVTKGTDGVTITLSNGNSFDIKNGANGTNAAVWTIGSDGYWYKDNVKQDYKAVGTDGTGSAGADGCYYVPNAETGNFDIYNGDGTFKQATNIAWKGTGVTAVENSTDVILYNVKKADGTMGSVTISKSNNLRSLVFVPQVYVDGVQGFTYDSYSYNALTLGNKDSKSEKVTAAATATAINPVVEVEYHVNPSNANVEELKDKLSFIVKKDVDYISSRAAASKDFNATPEFISFKDGILKVKVNITGIAATEEKISVLALNVEKENGENITSDYATVYKKDLKNLVIADPTAEAAKKGIANKDEHYRTLIGTADANAYNKTIVWAEGATEAESKLHCDTVVVYNSTLDLNGCVEAHELPCLGGDKISIADLKKLGLNFEFDIVKNYKVGTPVTDQADFIALADGVLTPKVYETEGPAAIGRTPIVRVRLMHGDNIVKVAYIKVYISGEATPTNQYELTIANFKYDCAVTPAERLSTVKDMNVQVYNEIGMSKDKFHTTYPYFYDYGANQTPADLGACEETVDPETQATHVIKWTISKNLLWDNADKTLTHRVRYYSGANQTGAYVELVLTAKVDDIKKSYNVEKADFISNYWNDTKTYTKFNVAVPTSTSDTDPANCTFTNDLNSPFTTWPKNSTEGTPGVLKLDQAVTGIKYFFCADDIKTITKIGDINVTFTTSADGLILYAKVGTAAAETVATIDNSGANNPNTVTYNKNSKIAKELLNTGKMYTYIGATGRVCDDDTKTVTITFDGKDHFQANFIRPVNIAEKAADNFIDAVDFGEKGSFIRLEDLIAPYDWRDREFSDYTNYWDFYGPFTITADVDNAECDLNGVRQGVPVTVELKADYTNLTMGTGADKKTSKYGFITYKNNGTKVSAFNIYVKVTVDYGWGTIKTGFITVPVASTITNN
ncbi:PL29 family lyase N-terminal domain-containing protein [Bacteroides oleiciplenus]|uniref:Uncharacterized protein n=1 Tax=Bacteroides oleiciplenus TaxID=626931 RepID=A0A3E5AZN9_9BACE|nr:PL29 family lyase N-terminal domain-containing protein [Bacteroides oleiciplenus]RGN30807.1 hypothetical protein DXB65_22805 [Bacteroides oleiciplenus]